MNYYANTSGVQEPVVEEEEVPNRVGERKSSTPPQDSAKLKESDREIEEARHHLQQAMSVNQDQHKSPEISSEVARAQNEKDIHHLTTEISALRRSVQDMENQLRQSIEKSVQPLYDRISRLEALAEKVTHN